MMILIEFFAAIITRKCINQGTFILGNEHFKALNGVYIVHYY